MKGPEKAAVLINIIGITASEKVLRYLRREEKKKLARAISSIKNITPQMEMEVLKELNVYYKLLKKRLDRLHPYVVFWDGLMILIAVFFIALWIVAVSYSNTNLYAIKLKGYSEMFFSSYGIYLLFYPLVAFIIYIEYKKGVLESILLGSNMLKDLTWGILVGFVTAFVMIATKKIFISPNIERGIYVPGVFKVLKYSVLALLGPVTEELFFRKYLYSKLREGLSVTSSVLIVSIIFAILHGIESLPYIIATFIASVIITLSYEYRASLVTPVVAHSLTNILAASVL